MTKQQKAKLQQIGAWGEDLAADYVEYLGWQIVERNWRCSGGEIDIIAIDHSGGSSVGVIIEVKTRRGTRFGTPLEAITAAKYSRLRRLASEWARTTDIKLDGLRVDVVGILIRAGESPQISHIRGDR